MTAIRRPGTTSAAVLLALAATAVGVHLSAPEWSRAVGLDVWNYAAVEEDHRTAVAERADLDARQEKFNRRCATANGFAARIVTGDANLATVATQLLALLNGDEAFRRTLLLTYPTVRDLRLLYARHAIERASRLLAHDPGGWEPVRVRLEAEYRTLGSQWASAE
ncbi:MAG: hypothetical protein ACKODX_21535 [Gemmata sp.]